MLMMVCITQFFSSCKNKSKEQLAIEASTIYLKKNMNDPSSYESIEWHSFEPTFGSYEYSREGSEYLKKIKKFERQVDSIGKLIKQQSNNDVLKINYKLGAEYVERMYDTILSKSDTMKPNVLVGYSIKHKMRGKNSYGALVLNDMKFYLDTNFVVLNSENAN